jgi:hypothetical protein
MYVYSDEGGWAKVYLYFGTATNGEGQESVYLAYKGADGSNKSVYVPTNGATVSTIAFDMDDQGAGRIFVNGVQLELEVAMAPYSGTFKPGTWHISYVQWATAKNQTFDYDVYAFGLVDTDKIEK